MRQHGEGPRRRQRDLVGRGSETIEQRSQGGNCSLPEHGKPHLKAAEAWIAQPMARQLLDGVLDVPAELFLALRPLFGHFGASPYLCSP
jgi:hypothetical protein